MKSVRLNERPGTHYVTAKGEPIAVYAGDTLLTIVEPGKTAAVQCEDWPPVAEVRAEPETLKCPTCGK